jgi:prepilin-type N-terminal cleavage/methylation domain-containing protein
MKRSQKAFTLIEVLIALLILAFAMTVLMESWGGSLRGIKKARVYSTVVMLIQRKVVEFEVANKEKKADQIEESQKGDFGSEFPDYAWEIKSQPFVFPNVFPVPTNGKQDEMTAKIIKTMTEYFEKAVREVSVTVIYKAGKKELKYSVNTFFIDYNEELPSGI